MQKQGMELFFFSVLAPVLTPSLCILGPGETVFHGTVHKFYPNPPNAGCYSCIAAGRGNIAVLFFIAVSFANLILILKA